MSVGKAIRGGAWLYIAGVSSSFLGYLYWLLASKFVDPFIIGSAAAVIGFTSIISGIFRLGIPRGIQKFLGISHSHNDKGELSHYFYSSLVYFFFSTIILLIIILSFIFLNDTILGFTLNQLYFALAIIILGSSGWALLFRALFNSTLRTYVNALAAIISSGLKLTVGLILLYLGFQFTGVALGFLIGFLASDIVYIIFSRQIIKPQLFSIIRFRKTVHASLASWIPNLITIFGRWMGVIGLYVMVGGFETGLYYMAFAIAMAIYTLPASVLNLMFPILSGMEDGRKRATYRVTKISIAVSTPIAVALIAYPHVPLLMLGPTYLAATTTLRLLLLGVLVSPLVMGFSSLIYSYGHYRNVTIIGLAGNISRIILYVILAKSMAETGIALAYSSGFLVALITTLPIAYKTGYRFPWVETFKSLVVPLLIAFTCVLLNISWLIGIPLTLLSTLTYPKLGLITRTDIAEMSTAILPKKVISTIYPYVKYVIHLIYGE
jgi:O-antigen/teichoic acid export membrane protein